MQGIEAARILAENFQIPPPRALDLAALMTAECSGQFRLEARAAHRLGRWRCHQITEVPPVEFSSS